MGVIKSQGIKQSLVVYTGVVFGAISWLFIYPQLDPTELGLIKFIEGTALLIVPFIFLGGNSLSVRFFPVFNDKEKGHNGFLFFLMLLLTIGFALFALLSFVFREEIFTYYANQSEEFQQYLNYLPYIIPVVFFMAFSSLLTQYTMNFKRIAIPAIFNDLFPKIGVPFLIVLYLSSLIVWPSVINGLVILYALIFICMVGYVIHLGQLHLKPRFEIFKKPLVKEMGVYASYGVFGSLGGQLATRIDLFMVGSLINLTNTGIFAFAAYIGNVVEIPRRAIARISAPIIAQSMQDGDIDNVAKIYRKSALVQFIVGAFILGGIWLSIDDLFSLMKNGAEYSRGKMVVLFLAIAILIDMLTGINDEIIAFSKYFRYRLYFILCLAVFNIVANYTFIAILDLGITGAALATLFSKSLYNTIKFILLKIKMNIQPFSIGMLWVLLIGISSYLLIKVIPLTDLVLINMFIKSALFTLMYGGLIYYLKISEDINELINSVVYKGMSILGIKK